MAQTGDILAFAGSLATMAVLLFAVAVGLRLSAASHTRRRGGELRRRKKELEADCQGLLDRLGVMEGDLRKLEAEEQALLTETAQLRKTLAAASADTFEIVHELGQPGAGLSRYEVEVVLSPAALGDGTVGLRTDPRLWQVRNVAHLWARTQREALEMAGRAFPARFGFVVTRFLNGGPDAAGAEG